MFTKSTLKKSFILLVALAVCLTVVFAACDTSKPFEPVEMPASATAEGNGGIAVKYGEWLYYINGNESSAAAANDYVAVEARVGSVVRIKLSDIDELVKISESDASSSNKDKQIAEYVREHAQTVVPNIYNTGNTTTTALNGLWIFGDRIYMTTPNDALTSGGNKLTDQLVLTSYKLDGSDRQRHHVFTSNAAQIMLGEVDGKVKALYVMSENDNSHGHTHSVTSVFGLDVASGTVTELTDEVSNVQFDIAGKAVFYTNTDNQILKSSLGAAEAKVLVENKPAEGKDASTVTFTLKSANAGYVYFTQKDSQNPTLDEKFLYYVTEESNGAKVALEYTPASYIGWKDKVVFTKSENGGSLYTIAVAGSNAATVELLPADQNDNSITLDRIVGDKLYYTTNSVSYVYDLNKAYAADGTNKNPIAYATGIGTTATGGLLPDIVELDANYNYVITLSSNYVTLVRYSIAGNTNSSNIRLTLTAAEEK